MRRRLPSLRLLTLLLPLTLLPLLLHRPPTPVLPPPLSPLLPPRPPHPPPPPSWKQPAVLSLHASAHNATHHHVTLFTSGIDTQSFSRTLSPIACLLPPHNAFPLHTLHPASVSCLLPAALLTPSTRVALLLLHDDALRAALATPARHGGELFTLSPQDVRPLSPTEHAALVLHAPPRHPLRSATAPSARPGLARVIPDAAWRPAALDEEVGVRWELCLATAMKQYPFLLGPWLEYYKRLGVDHVFVYDNGAPDDLTRVLRPWDGFAEAAWWPWPRSQMQSNNHLLLATANRCRYVAFFDADEFVMVGGDPRGAGVGALKSYVRHRRAQGYHQISFRFLVMVNSGFVRRPHGDLPELYVHRAEDQPMSSGKVVIDRDRDWQHHKIHIVKGKQQKMYWNTTLELDPESLDHNAMLVHYTHRSWEDFVAKNEVGGASVMTTGRPPKKLDLEKPDPEYMNESKVQFDRFRERWREVMKIKDDGRVTLTWKDRAGCCTARYCPTCWRPSLEDTRCEDNDELEG